MNKKTVIANFKMNKTCRETVAYMTELLPLVEKYDAYIGICPPFTAIKSASRKAKGSNVIIGAQNLNENEKGTYTGEISTAMLIEAGAKFSLIGHSERRSLYNETNELINKKIKKALASGFTSVLCIGETALERTHKKTQDIINIQLSKALEGVYANELKYIFIAYEPLWAISKGTGSLPLPTKEEISGAVNYIRKVLENLYDKQTSQNTIVLYGGSVDDVNASSLSTIAGVDGALVGGASLNTVKFSKIVEGFSKK